MNCPCCSLVVKDESHVQRCHPEYLQRLWEEAGMNRLEIAREFTIIACNLLPLDAVMSECLMASSLLNISVTPDREAAVHLKLHDGRTLDAHGVTLYAALCLALDRIRYS